MLAAVAVGGRCVILARRAARAAFADVAYVFADRYRPQELVVMQRDLQTSYGMSQEEAKKTNR